MRPITAPKITRRFRRKARCTFVALLFIATAQIASATTRTVTSLSDPTDPNGGLTLRQAIAASFAGDTINFAPNLSGGTIDLANNNGELAIGRDLTITGPTGGVRIHGDSSYYHRILHVIAGTVTISHLTISGGYERGADGASGTFSGNGQAGSDGMGGGILNSGTLVLTDCLVITNYAYGGRGGSGYSGTSTRSFGARGGDGLGAGIYNAGTLTLVDSTVDGNSAAGGSGGTTFDADSSGARGSGGGSGGGGGIYNEHGATLTIQGCTLSYNSAAGGFGGNGSGAGQAYGGFGGFGAGGGLSNLGTASVTNCTITGNDATGGQGGARGSNAKGSNSPDGSGGSAFGGGISTTGLNLSNCTLSSNTATGGTAGGSTASQGSTYGGGLDVFGAPVNVLNTIVAGNTTEGDAPRAPDVNGSIASQGHNLIGKTDDSSGWIASDLTGTAATPLDPQLLELADNGGPTKTHALTASSVAIDAGDDAVLSPPYNLTTDQRGVSRKAGAHVDIGAFELRAFTTFLVTNTADSGAGSLRQAVADANTEDQPDAIVFNIPAGDPGYDAATQSYSINLTSGELDITNPVSINGGSARILVQRSGAAQFRLFNVSANGVVLANLFLRNGASVGGPSAPGLGGGVLNTGGLTLINCALSGNTAVGGDGSPQVFQGLPGGEGYGGAILNGGTLIMTNCTLSGNSVRGGAGGIGYSTGGVIARGGNGGNGRGGGLFTDSGAVTITNCTFTQNSAAGGAGGQGDIYGPAGTGIGGGAFFSSGNIALFNSILSGNTAPGGADYSGSANMKANLIGGSPQLDSALSYNDGGSTPTIALLAGSPAIDAGDDTLAPPTDQRGYSRRGVSDIGAFEFGGSAPTPPPAPSRLANISTRLSVGTGENALIGGFIVTGTQPKKIIVRGIGPSLPFGGRLENPTIELRDGAGALIDSNDDWVNSPNKQAIIDSTIPPADSLESAIVVTLPANNAGYTAIVRGVNDGTGIGLVEAYDLDNSVDSKLANISTRGFVQTGDNVLIAGTIVVGQTAQKVMVRAIGPSLGFAGALGNPTLEVRDQDGGLVDANDNWVDSPNKQAITDSGIPPSNDLESAIVSTLPGNGASYTAIVRGANDTTGIAVVEVYALQ